MQDKFDDSKGVIRSCHFVICRNGQKKKDKKANNDLQNTIMEY
jgi:hypothetical protein